MERRSRKTKRAVVEDTDLDREEDEGEDEEVYQKSKAGHLNKKKRTQKKVETDDEAEQAEEDVVLADIATDDEELIARAPKETGQILLIYVENFMCHRKFGKHSYFSLSI